MNFRLSYNDSTMECSHPRLTGSNCVSHKNDIKQVYKRKRKPRTNNITEHSSRSADRVSKTWKGSVIKATHVSFALKDRRQQTKTSGEARLVGPITGNTQLH